MIAIILAAGFATRMHPLTLREPKALLEVGGRPALDWLFDRLEEVGEWLDDVVVVVNEVHRVRFGEWVAARAGGGLRVELLANGVHDVAAQRGALGDLRFALESRVSGEDVLVSSSDNLPTFSLAPFLGRFRERNTPIVLYRESDQPLPPRRHGVLSLDDHGVVRAFHEKPAKPASRYLARSIYAFPAGIEQVLRAYFDQGGDPDAPGYLLEWLVAGGRELSAFECPGPIHDVGSIAGLQAARRHFDSRA